MALRTGKFRAYAEKEALSKKLAEQMRTEQEEESDFSGFLSMAAPLAASLILPGVGTALMGGLGGMGAFGGGLASAFGGTAFGGGATGTMLGGLLTGGAKGLGTYAIGEGMEGIGRSKGYGGEVEDINLGGSRRGREAQEEGRAAFQDTIDIMEKGQRKSALTAGLTAGVDKMGGFDKIKEMSASAGKSLFGGADKLTQEEIGSTLAEKAISTPLVGDAATATAGGEGYNILDIIKEIESGGKGETLAKGLEMDTDVGGYLQGLGYGDIGESFEWGDESLNALQSLGIDQSMFESEEEFQTWMKQMGII